MADKWICVRTCHYLQRYWMAGESLNDTSGYEDAPPGKHFALNGILRDEVSDIVRPGDDPRSTIQIREDLLVIHEIETPEDTSRRDLFNRWIHAEKAAVVRKAEGPATPSSNDSEGSETPPLPPADGVTVVDPMGTTKFSELGPDDVDKLKNAEIAKSMKIRFGIAVANDGRGQKKENLLQQALQLEAHAANQQA